MSVAELLLTLIIALIVFGPKKLPMLAQHLGKWVGCVQYYKQQVVNFWQQQQLEQQLQENIKKAEKEEAGYLQDKEL